MSVEPNVAEDDFGKFFDQLDMFSREDKPVPNDFGAATTPVETPAPAVAVEPPAAVTPTPDTPAADPSVPATGADGVPAAADPVTPEPVIAPAAATPSSDAMLARLVDTLERRTPPPSPAQPAAPRPQRLYTDEELGVLSTFQKDWPDQAAAIQLLLRGATVQTQQDILGRVGQALGAQQQTVQAVAANYQIDALHRTIPDYDQVADPVIAWARTDKSIPPFLRTAYEGVIQNGDVSEIKHLVDTWRTATGKSVTPSGAPAANPAARPANELSEAAKQAARSLAPVTSKRTAVVTTADPTTFDDMWDKLTAKAP